MCISIHILKNSAVGALLDIDLETAQQCVNTNVFGTLKLTRAVAPHMAQRGKGKIVNVGSVVGYSSTPWAGMKYSSISRYNLKADVLFRYLCVIQGCCSLHVRCFTS